MCISGCKQVSKIKSDTMDIIKGSKTSIENVENLELAKLILKPKREKINISSVLSKSSGRFIVGVDGIVTDQQTGLMWYILDTHTELQECLDYDAAGEYVENLNIGGYKDWRLPASNDLVVILNAKSSFPKSGAEWYWSSEAFWKGHYEFDRIVILRNDNEWVKGEAELTECGAVRAVRP